MSVVRQRILIRTKLENLVVEKRAAELERAVVGRKAAAQTVRVAEVLLSSI
jgi:hypothetical protein